MDKVAALEKIPNMNETHNKRAPWRDTLHEIIFGAETPAGKWFDILLIVSILASVLTVMLDSVSNISTN